MRNKFEQVSTTINDITVTCYFEWAINRGLYMISYSLSNHYGNLNITGLSELMRHAIRLEVSQINKNHLKFMNEQAMLYYIGAKAV